MKTDDYIEGVLRAVYPELKIRKNGDLRRAHGMLYHISPDVDPKMGDEPCDHHAGVDVETLVVDVKVCKFNLPEAPPLDLRLCVCPKRGTVEWCRNDLYMRRPR